MFTLAHLLKGQQLKTDKVIDIAKSIYYLSGLTVTLLNKEHEKIFGYGTNHDVFASYADIKEEFQQFITLNISKSADFFMFHTSYGFSYITSLLKDSKNHHGTILVGPIFLDTPSEHQINEVIKAKSLSFAQRGSIKTIYSQIPLVLTPRIYYIEKTLASLINTNSSFEIDATHYQHTDTDEDLMLIDVQLEPETTNHDYSLERFLLSKVATGDIDKVIEIFNEQMKTRYMVITGQENLRQSKNGAIELCTLLSRAAIEGGVDPEHSLTLADAYHERIEGSKNLDEVVDLLERMCAKFTNSVLNVSSINHVSVIKKASRYVHNHLSEPIRLQEVADYVGLSPNYFSSLFKKEMNLAFADYINHTRIKESQYLLHTTNHSILDIAISVGFNNQNYFTTIFKKTTGITPKQYRMRSAKSKI